tara:strand:+ start:12491 stop:12895 length:405 start_codon:yes stop_codon:yes gene_type:complete
MFNLELIKHKRKLKQDFSYSFELLKDELGNVPLEMQTDAFLNGVVLSICENYLNAQNITKNTSKAVVVDAVCEELYRRESIAVQTRIDQWLVDNDTLFMQGYQYIKQQSDHKLNLQLLTKYIQQNFEQATGLML